MTSTRDRLEHRGARSRVVRIVVVVTASLLLLLGAAALSGLWWLPPVLAETPRERVLTDTALVLSPAVPSPSTSSSPAAGAAAPISATVTAGTGWVIVGVGPFLPADRAVLLSPDGVLRIEATAVATTGATAEAGQAVLEDVLAASGTFADGEEPDLSAAAWSDETLASGAVVQYAELARGSETILVAVLRPAASASQALSADQTGIALALLAAAPTDRSAAYRATIADLLATTTFSAPELASGTP